MSPRSDRNPHRTGYQPLHDLNLSSFWWHSGNYWSPLIEKEIIEPLKEPVKEGEEKNSKFQVKALCVFVAVLALLSFGMYIQANAIAQVLEEVARISVLQAIEPLND